MSDNRAVIGDVNVVVKARLDVDERTFKTCLDLINLYGVSHNLKHMVIKFGETSDGLKTLIFKSEEDIKKYLNLEVK